MISQAIINELRKLRKAPYVKGTISLGSFEVMSAMLDHCEDLFDAAEQGLQVEGIKVSNRMLRAERTELEIEKRMWEDRYTDTRSSYCELEAERDGLRKEKEALKKHHEDEHEHDASYATLEAERDALKRRVKKLETPTSTIALVASWRQRTERAIRSLELTIEGFCAEGGLCDE